MVSGEMLDGATATFDQNNRPAVSFVLNSNGARRFGKVTGANIGRPFAIILDGQVVHNHDPISDFWQWPDYWRFFCCRNK